VIDEKQLDRARIFRDLNAAARRELAVRGVARRFAAGELLWAEGTPARGLFVVLAGRVRVVRAPGGRQHVIHTEGAGATLGELPLFEGGAYPATAIAAEPTLCLVLDRAAIEAAIAADPSLAFALLQGLARRVRTLIARLGAVRGRSVRARLAGWVLRRAEGEGPFTLGATQAEVAEELGTVREVVVKELRALRAAGILRSAGRGRMEVADPARLRRLATEGEG
jgi:CRP-like cAMP-binding protein